MLLKITEEIQEEMKKHRDKWKWKHNDPKPMGCTDSSCKREVYSKKQAKSQINKLNLHLKQWEKRTNKT